ncbi:hypothetical protein BC628DRAFT_1390885 [Trametes gibbosa]|nr:hypothetical protein BC628DRAFT_1390885 [Trametes gibbosa]
MPQETKFGRQYPRVDVMHDGPGPAPDNPPRGRKTLSGSGSAHLGGVVAGGSKRIGRAVCVVMSHVGSATRRNSPVDAIHSQGTPRPHWPGVCAWQRQFPICYAVARAPRSRRGYYGRPESPQAARPGILECARRHHGTERSSIGRTCAAQLLSGNASSWIPAAR